MCLRFLFLVLPVAVAVAGCGSSSPTDDKAGGGFCGPQDGQVSVWFPRHADGEEVAPRWHQLDLVLERHGVRLNADGCGRLRTSDGGAALVDAPGVVYGRSDPSWVDDGGGLSVEKLTPQLAQFALEFAKASDLTIAAGRLDRPSPVVALLSESQRPDLPTDALYDDVSVAKSSGELLELLKRARP